MRGGCGRPQITQSWVRTIPRERQRNHIRQTCLELNCLGVVHLQSIWLHRSVLHAHFPCFQWTGGKQQQRLAAMFESTPQPIVVPSYPWWLSELRQWGKIKVGYFLTFGYMDSESSMYPCTTNTNVNSKVHWSPFGPWTREKWRRIWDSKRTLFVTIKTKPIFIAGQLLFESFVQFFLELLCFSVSHFLLDTDFAKKTTKQRLLNESLFLFEQEIWIRSSFWAPPLESLPAQWSQLYFSRHLNERRFSARRPWGQP